MKSVFKKISFWSDKHMSKKPSKVLTKLANVKDSHLESNIQNPWTLLKEHIRATLTTKPGWHKTSTTEYFIAPKWANEIVDDGICPLN